MSNKLPSSLMKRLNQEHGFEEELFFKVHDEGEQVTSIRYNPFKSKDIYPGSEIIPWSSYGRYLDKRPSFVADPLFHAGCYYVQEASSMFIEHVLRQTTDLSAELRVLDLCAAPGGKSTLVLSLLSDKSLLVSNEIIKTRVPVLSDNLTKWGKLNSVVCNNDPKDFQRLRGYFDILIVDAPCSGSGMWRKDPNTLSEWSESNVALCSQRQQRILADAYPSLREGGLLVYSTCSYSKDENEDIADWLCDTFELVPVKIPIEEQWGIIETESDKHQAWGYRFYPHKVKGEGFFLSCFQKKEEEIRVGNVKSKPQKLNERDISIVKSWVTDPQKLFIFPVKDSYAIMYAAHSEDVKLLQSALYLKKSGVIAGKIIGKDMVPDHELALSVNLSNNVNRAALDYSEAISYLRKDELKIEDVRTGWNLMCYEGMGLGWAKVLPNRVNNYYPKELRILKEI